MAFETLASPGPTQCEVNPRRALQYGVAMAFASIGVLGLALWPSDGAGAVVALYPLDWSRATAFAAAAQAAEGVSLGRAAFVVEARSNRPGLAGRLRRSGAWLVVNMNGADCGERAVRTQ